MGHRAPEVELAVRARTRAGQVGGSGLEVPPRISLPRYVRRGPWGDSSGPWPWWYLAGLYRWPWRHRQVPRFNDRWPRWSLRSGDFDDADASRSSNNLQLVL